jgi:hypothetical protein
LSRSRVGSRSNSRSILNNSALNLTRSMIVDK